MQSSARKQAFGSVACFTAQHPFGKAWDHWPATPNALSPPSQNSCNRGDSTITPGFSKREVNVRWDRSETLTQRSVLQLKTMDIVLLIAAAEQKGTIGACDVQAESATVP